jgi:hypothetical protein
MKTTIAFVLGVALTISAFIWMGFTGSGGSNQNGQILIPNEGGGAYFFNGKNLFFITQSTSIRVEGGRPECNIRWAQ